MNASPPPTDAKSANRFALVIGAVFAVCFWDVLAGVRTLYFRDFSLFGYPLAVHLKRSFWSGELPLWNPFNNCGLPFLAQWNTMVLYPGSFLYELLPVPWSVNLFCLAHLVLGGFGMRRLVWNWTRDTLAADLSGLLFAFNGLALNCLMWPNNSAAWGWMPWVIGALCSGRVLIARAAITAAMQILTGAPEIILFTWLIAGVLGLTTGLRRIGFLAGATALAGCLAAPQLWPFIELYLESHRTGGDFATGGWAMSLKGLAHFFVPLVGGVATEQGVYLQESQKWTSSYYVGTLTVALAALGTRGRLGWTLSALLIGSLLMALGLAPTNFFRYPIKWVVPVVFCAIALAGSGLAELKAGRARKPFIMAAVVTQALVIFAGLSGSGAVREIFNGILRSVFLWGGVALAIWLSKPRPFEKQRVFGLAFLMLMVGDIATHMPWQNPTVKASALAPKEPPKLHGRSFLTLEAYDELRSRMLANAEMDVAIRREALLQNLNLIDGIPKLDGFFSLYPQREREFRRALYVTDLPEAQGALDFLGVERFSKPGRIGEWESRSSFLPAVTGGQNARFLREGQILRAMLRRDFDPVHTFYLWNRYTNIVNPSLQIESEDRALGASLISRKSHEIIISVARATTPFAIVAESYDKNWRAEADGKPARVFRANYNFMAVKIPAGAATVALRYRSNAFEGGLAVAAGALLVCAIPLARKGRKT